jgi:hypothetical protein
MTKMNGKKTPRQDIEALLPWHAAGTLNPREAELVEAALAEDPELAREYEAVRQELGETIRFNETLGVPSARAMARLMADIEADRLAGSRPPFNILTWVADRLAGLSPRALAWSAAAAALAIVLQGAIIAGLFVRSEDGGFKTVLHHDDARIEPGTFVLVRFAPAATAADITGFLQSHSATLVEGPRRDGSFRLRVSERNLSADDVAGIVKRMQSDTKVASFAAPSR